jgi:selenocysteine lyase/cysteine desulfurase
MPALGYRSLTPKGNESPIVSFAVKNVAATNERLRKHGVIVTMGNYMRVSPSLFNNSTDIDRLLETLA